MKKIFFFKKNDYLCIEFFNIKIGIVWKKMKR